jgi:8-oxo-dGTP diphosphatase
MKFLRHQVCHQPIGFNLLPEKFTLLQLQALYEAILNTTLDKPNFRRKIMKMNLLTACNEKQQGVPHRAANLYRFDSEAYKHLSESGFSFEI